MGKTRHLGVFSRQNRVFSRHKQMSSPSGGRMAMEEESRDEYVHEENVALTAMPAIGCAVVGVACFLAYLLAQLGGGKKEDSEKKEGEPRGTGGGNIPSIDGKNIPSFAALLLPVKIRVFSPYPKQNSSEALWEAVDGQEADVAGENETAISSEQENKQILTESIIGGPLEMMLEDGEKGGGRTDYRITDKVRDTYSFSDEEALALLDLNELRLNSARIARIEAGEISLETVLYGLVAGIDGTWLKGWPNIDFETDLGHTPEERDACAHLLMPFFIMYDRTESGALSQMEFHRVLRDLKVTHPEGLDVKFTRHETGKTRHLGVFSRQNRVFFSRHKQKSSPSGHVTEEEERRLWMSTSHNSRDEIEFDSFLNLCLKLCKVMHSRKQKIREKLDLGLHPHDVEHSQSDTSIPDDIKHLSPDEQQARIAKRAAWMAGAGCLLVFVFADPFPEGLDTICDGKRPGFNLGNNRAANDGVSPVSDESKKSPYPVPLDTDASSNTPSIFGLSLPEALLTMHNHFQEAYFLHYLYYHSHQILRYLPIQPIFALSPSKTTNSTPNKFHRRGIYFRISHCTVSSHQLRLYMEISPLAAVFRTMFVEPHVCRTPCPTNFFRRNRLIIFT